MVASILLAPGVARAIQMSWNVDTNASYVQLTVPDQAVYVASIGQNVTARLRDAGDNSQWTDAGGRRAAVAGTILADYADAVSITFPSNAHNLYALEQTNLRPNPAQWDPLTTNYTGTGTAPAAFGAKVRGTYLVTVDVAYLALRNVRFDVASGVVPVIGGALATNQTQFGISAATGDVDGLQTFLGQPVPDVLAGELPPIVQTNNAGGTIQNLGGRDRKLTYSISMPIAIEVEGMTLTGSAVGQIVAYGTIPELPSLRIAPAAIQTVLIAWPTNAIGFVLQQNPVLGTTNWVTVTNSPVVVGSEKQVTLPASEGGAFYRLRQ